MITRIVRMEFQPARVGDFLAHFDTIKNLIRCYPGVQDLELHRDVSQSNVFYTYSTWDGEAELAAYRESDLFKSTWFVVRPWFGEKPQAFSLKEKMVVDGK